MLHDAARPKKLRVQDEESTAQEPMRGSQPTVRRNPSTDQKKSRRQLQRSVNDAVQRRIAANGSARLTIRVCDACGSEGFYHGTVGSVGSFCCHACDCTLSTLHVGTVLPTNAELLQKGHVVRLPSGQRVKVKGVRPHENSGGHVYLDTDIGTSVVNRKSQFQVVQGDAANRGTPFRQQSNPTAPGNFNTDLGESTERAQQPSGGGKCPSCGKGALVNHGGKLQCRNCGYASSGGQADFGEPGYRRPTTAYVHDGISAVARRAQALVERTEQ